MDSRQHWEGVYSSKAPDAVSWYAPHLEQSLAYIRASGLSPSASVIDVGGGESTLVDDLLDAGYQNLSVLDLSSTALAVCRDRLGARADQVRWLNADVLAHRFEPGSIDIWHDRAVFHFLTEEAQRRTYLRQILQALRPGGFAIVGTFGPTGPTLCSGLPVRRYDAPSLHAEFGEQFQRLDDRLAVHTTPWGTPQQFVYCLCRRAPFEH